MDHYRGGFSDRLQSSEILACPKNFGSLSMSDSTYNPLLGAGDFSAGNGWLTDIAIRVGAYLHGCQE